ncbi:MAG: sulfatase-like hydrolase/transferase [Acidobacteria bacterium]|nr:sulfatase-like hydrolase/transferase [Acidobacteriota bacterium]
MSPAAALPDWNVLLLTIDSCHAGRMSLYGNKVKTTPNLDRWARQATVFDRAYSVSAWTAPGLVSLLSGTLPGVHGVDSRDRRAPSSLPTLLKIFRQQGYEVPNLNFFTFAPYYQNLGLPPVDRSYFTQEDGEELLHYLDRNAARPFFIWYHTTQVHQPYDPPQDVLQQVMRMHEETDRMPSAGGRRPEASSQEGSGRSGRLGWEEAFETPGIQAVRRGAIVPRGSVEFRSGDDQALRALYDSEIYRVDSFLGRVLDKLREQKLEERTLVVITADHGEELLEHGFVGHASTSLNARLFEEVTRIPLILRLPGQKTGRRVSALAQQVDVAATILDLLGWPAPPVSQGQTLKPFLGMGPGRRPVRQGPSAGSIRSGTNRATRRSEIFLESVIAGNQTSKERENIWVRAVRTPAVKYVQESSDGRITGESLFDLRQDPGERRNLAALRSREVRRFRERMARLQSENQAVRDRYLPPDPASASFAGHDCPAIQMPEPGQTLDYALHTGALLFQWTGDADAVYRIEYDIGQGDHHVAGQYEAKGNYQVLGPFPPELWRSLKAWNPFRIRVAYKGASCWSDWRTFQF